MMNVEGGMDGPGFLDPIPEDVSVAASSSKHAANLSTVSAVASSDSGGMAIVDSKKRRRTRMPDSATMDDTLSDANASLGGANEHGLEVPLPIRLEEKDDDASKSTSWSPTCKKWFIMFLGIVSILAVAVGVGMFVILDRLQNNGDALALSDALTLSPTAAPNFSPFRVSYSTGSPIASPAYTQDQVLKLDSLFLQVPGTTVNNLVDLDTPQGKAREWMINSDARIDVNDEQRVQQRYTMCVLYYSTNGDVWSKNVNWLRPEKTECDWFGVSCNNGNVKMINLPENNVTGTLPNEIVSLSSLTALNMSYDKISGTIPKDMFNLMDQLDTVDLQENQLVGTVPKRTTSIVNSGLRYINVGNNQLTGTFPFFVRIEYISFAMNNLISIDENYSTSALMLRKFKGFHNKLAGPLFTTWSLPNLIELDLGYNFLTGTIPQDLWNLPTLKSFMVDHCNLTGPLPAYSESDAMHRLWLDSNSLTGTIPSNFGWNWTKLYSVQLQNNLLTGSISMEQCDQWNIQNMNDNVFQSSPSISKNENGISRGGMWTFDVDCQIDCACCTNTNCASSAATDINGRR